MKAINKIILGVIVSISSSVAEAQTTKSMFANAQPTKRIYNNNEILLPNYLQFKNIGAVEKVLESTVGNNRIQISWQTKTETNTSHFELQRSSDGQFFEPIETIAASGVSIKRCNYSTTVNSDNANNYPLYYRIKSVFVNGEEAYTATLMVNQNLAIQASIKKQR